MTEQKTFTFTSEQIKDIFNAGVRHGAGFGAATLLLGGFQECVEAVYHIVNENTPWGSPGYTAYSTVEDWFNS